MGILKYIKKYPLLIIPIFLVIPLIMSLLMKVGIFSFSEGSIEGWLGFWGSYIGGTLGALGVIITTYFLIEAEKQNSREVAKLNDQTERDRINTTFLLNKNEELMKILSDIFELNNSRYNWLSSYIRNTKEIRKCRSKNEELIKLKIISGQNVDIKLQKIKEEYNDLFSKNSDILEHETQIRSKIITLLANAQIITTYFNNLEIQVTQFKSKLSQSLRYFYSVIEAGNFLEDELLLEIEKNSQDDMNDINKLLKSCAKNLEEIQYDFINKLQ
ncbi:hypothetical protein [Brevibacillus reuszeri]|uniref:hypothetical protein n=1 Tax=Brevibacillus reuszeri TaxID=54915 RepID=UPI00289E116A|nr:hypothetical protein [Brevibacillus reuszeri]